MDRAWTVVWNDMVASYLGQYHNDGFHCFTQMHRSTSILGMRWQSQEQQQQFGTSYKCFSDWIAGCGNSTSSSRPTTSCYRQDFETGLEIWKRWVHTSWKEQLSAQDYDGLFQCTIQMDQLWFRVSCVREMSPLAATTTTSTKKKKCKKQHKKNEEEDQQTTGKNSSSAPHTTNTGQQPSPSYNCQEFVNAIMDACSNSLIPKYSGPQCRQRRRRK
jgi:hypothetical protein